MESKTSKQIDPVLLDRLCAEIEDAWEQERDDTVVDRLAAAHPAFAAELYDFLQLLIYSEFDAGVTKEDRARSIERTRDWLEVISTVRAIAQEQCRQATPTTPEPATLKGQTGNTTDEKIAATTGALPLIGLLQRITQEKPSVITGAG